MATITRSITAVVDLVLPVPGFNSTKTVTIAASATQDLLDAVSLETLQTMQPLIAKLIASGSATSAATLDDTTRQGADFALKQTAIATADLVAVATADGSDAATTQALANVLKAQHNLTVTLVNALKAKVNAMNA